MFQNQVAPLEIMRGGFIFPTETFLDQRSLPKQYLAKREKLMDNMDKEKTIYLQTSS